MKLNIRFTVLATAIILWTMISIVVSIAQAASGSLEMNAAGLTASYSGGGTWSGGGGSATGSVAGTDKQGCTAAKSQTATLTLTNTNSDTRTLSFNYTITQNNGSVQIDGDTYTTNSSFTKELGANESVAITLTSGQGSSKVTGIELAGISLGSADATVTVTFQKPTNGSYTVNGAAVTDDTKISQSATKPYALVATPASGFRFFGWFSTVANGYIDYSAETSVMLDAETTIYPVFISATSAIFQTGGIKYYDLNAANAAANNGDKLIILVESGTLPAGPYEISAGVKLLIPRDTAYSSNFSPEPTMTTTDTSPSEYSCLTLASGAVINCYGQINLSAQMFVTSGREPSHVSGPYGAIDLSEGSTLNMIGTSAVLYCYGYIGGAGEVVAQTGSKVYEILQVRDWRGGDATSTLQSTLLNNSFMFSQYYLQNVEATLKIQSGSTVYGVFGLSALSNAIKKQVNAPIIGTGVGLFQMDATRARDYISKRYDSTTDRMEIELHGNIITKSMDISIDIGGTNYSLNTANYICPIPMNFTITVKKGSNATLSEKLKLLPGTKIIVENGATVTVEKEVYLYDHDDWNSGNYTYSGNVYQLAYVHSRKGAPVSRNSNLDASIVVDGTVFAKAPIYTTNRMLGSDGKVVATGGSYAENGGDAAITGAGELITSVYGDTNLLEVQWVTVTSTNWLGQEETKTDMTNLVTITCIPAVGKVLGASSNPTQLAENTTYYGFNWNCAEYWSTSGAILDAMSLDMEGQLELNLKFYVHPTLVKDGFNVYVTEAYNAITEGANNPLGANNVWNKAVSSMTLDENGRYVITQGIAAGEMTGKVTVKFANGDTAYTIYDKYLTADNHVGEVEKTARDYIDMILADDSKSQELKDLCMAAAIYGGLAQEYFGTNVDNLAYGVIFANKDAVTAQLPTGLPTANGENTFTTTLAPASEDMTLRATGFRVDLNASAFIRIYFENWIDGVSVAVSHGYDKHLPGYNIGKDEQGRCYVDITNIPIALWNDEYTLEISQSDGKVIYTVNTSVLAWAQEYIKRGTNEAQVLMAKAMFLFNQKADAYFTTE